MGDSSNIMVMKKRGPKWKKLARDRLPRVDGLSGCGISGGEEIEGRGFL